MVPPPGPRRPRGGCGRPGDPGRRYLAIDWLYAPEALYFPAFPQIVTAGQYVRHEPGSYQGEYIAWDGSYWLADYWINVEAGGAAPLLGTGDHGDDYYLSLWLYSFGPSMYVDDIVVRSVVPGPESGARSNLSAADDAIRAARERAAGMIPERVRVEYTAGPFRVRAEFSGYLFEETP